MSACADCGGRSYLCSTADGYCAWHGPHVAAPSGAPEDSAVTKCLADTGAVYLAAVRDIVAATDEDALRRAMVAAAEEESMDTTLTPSHAWDVYVGDQSVAEFLSRSALDAAAAVAAYVGEAPMCADLDDDERGEAAALLLAYIDAATR